MSKFELVFIPSPGRGHLPSTIEMANLLVTRDHRLSVTLLVQKLPFETQFLEHIQSLSAAFADKSIRFIVLPEPPFPKETTKNFLMNVLHIIESYKPSVREAVTKLTGSQLVGFVVDMFCTTMVDVAKEFEVPCYVFYTSSATSLAIVFDLQELYDQNNGNEAVEQLQRSDDAELVVPSFVNPIPRKVVPHSFFDYETALWFYDNARTYRSEIKGILVNTFEEMESHVMKSMSSGLSRVPPLYTVGPILHLNDTGTAGSCRTLDCSDVLKWLDCQPPSSVVFLCFGSGGSFEKDQVEEIAGGLERSGARFVWSLRQPPSKGKFEAPSDYVDVEDILPEGFLDRTVGIGKVIGWAPQVEILAHPATGGFVSHCGWNSMLESVWHGVPTATWPLTSEQQLNAFEMVVELGLAVEIAMDYHRDEGRIVGAMEIESGIRKLMEEGDEIRRKVKEKSEESKRSIMGGGSSFVSLGHFIDDVLANSKSRGD